MTQIDQSAVNARTTAAEIEPRAIASWPAREAVLLNGWLLRFTNGFTHRGNSVATLQFSGNVAHATGKVEDAYCARALRPMFQVASLVAPADLESLLLARGYAPVTPTYVLVATPAEMRARLPAATEVAIAREPGADFTGLVIEGSRSEGDGAERIEIHSRIKAECACLTAFSAGRAVACGTATLVDGYVGINMMRTTPAHRRRGHGMRILSTIAHWAGARAAHAYLSVEVTNGPALALYRRAGFAFAYSYLYYRKP